MEAGELITRGIPNATTLFVAASDSTSGVAAGCATMYGILPSLPADTTLTTPKFTTSVNISLTSSSRCPKAPPIDMLMMYIVVFPLPEGAADRHANDVHRVVQSTRVSGVERKIDALGHGDAATGGGHGTTDLDRIQLCARRRAEVNSVETMAAGGIGCESAVPVEVERIRIGRQRPIGPRLAGEIVTANYLAGREQTRRRCTGGDGLRCGVIGYVARTTQIVMGVVDACVQHRDACALALVTVVLGRHAAHVGERGREVGLRRWRRGGEGDRVVGHRTHGDYAANAVERLKLARINRNHERVVGLANTPEFHPAQDSYLGHDRILLLLQLREVGTLLVGGHRDAILLGIGSDGNYQRRILQFYR